MKVLKFGGSSVADADRIKTVVSIVLDIAKTERIAVVFSAMKGVTDMLLTMADKAEKGDASYREDFAALTDKQKTAVDGLIADEKEKEEVFSVLSGLLDELKDILHGVELVKECSKRSKDLIASFGERLNCNLISAYIKSLGYAAEYVDAREIIRTDASHGEAVVDFETTYGLIEKRLSGDNIYIVTGFIGSTEEGVTTTLGRNGSDYSAAIVGAGVGASEVEIWTDVDGVLSADPRIVKDAFVLEEVSFAEAMELSFFGAKVIHPYTMIPAVEKNIPIVIKNTMNPSYPGTRIVKDAKRHKWPITGIASIPGVSLINIEGSGMMGTPGIAARVFSALAESKINIIMISQASSEHSICIVCRSSEARKAISALEKTLEYEKRARLVSRFDCINDLEIVAIVGENMRGTPGIAGRLFDAVGKAGINVHAIAQGSSELNLSFVVDEKEGQKTIKTVHDAFFKA
ncbi:aspartate kinase [Spirochaetia bacterium 38H-sp]|uniref:Aspartokinase n=1 Tax=Rarispira pelagica TaxID=3141764 RepID=A0ABU9U9K5_9SPIR